MSNKYAKHYKLLIEKAIERGSVEGFSERHHVLPRSLGGPDDNENLVELTGREHFVAHLLLHKMNPEHAGMAMAVLMMTGRGKYVGRTYELLKRSAARVIGQKTGDALRGVPKSEEHRQKIREARALRDPEVAVRTGKVNRGKKRSAEAKARMSKAGMNRSPEGKRNIEKAAKDPVRRANTSAAILYIIWCP